MEFIGDLSIIEAVIRRHLPSCFRLDGVDVTTNTPEAGNPALFAVIARFRRVDSSPEPFGWGHNLSSEIRAGWDGTEFALRLQQIPSSWDTSVV